MKFAENDHNFIIRHPIHKAICEAGTMIKAHGLIADTAALPFDQCLSQLGQPAFVMPDQLKDILLRVAVFATGQASLPSVPLLTLLRTTR